MPQAPNRAESPGVAWLGALLIAAATTWVLHQGALGRSAQMLWPWGADAAYFLQRAWQGAVDPIAERTLILNEDGRGTWGGKHHSPILALYVPWVALWPRYETLLVAQVGLFGAGVLSLFGACWRASRDRLTALALLAAAASVPGLLAIGIGDFRPLALAVVLVPAVLAAAVFGGAPAALAATVLACATREEVAPMLLAALPLLVRERSRRTAEAPPWSAWRVPTLAVGLPALLWMLLTAARARHLNPMAGIPGLDGVPLPAAPLHVLELLGRDLAGTLAEPPRLLVRHLQLGGLAGALVLLRPWALLPLLVSWVGACLASGVVNPGQVHYFAPFVGLLVGLVPLALGAPEGSARRGWLVRAACVVAVVAHLAGSWGPPSLSADEALFVGQQPRLPAWELAGAVGDEERVLASDWLLPTLRARQELRVTGDLADRSGWSWEDFDVLLLVPHDPALEAARAAGFVEVDRRDQALLLRRPTEGAP